MTTSRSKNFLSIIIFSYLIIIVSCNNNDKKSPDANVTTTSSSLDTGGKVNGNPVPLAVIALKQYKLTKDQIVIWKTPNPPAKKVILKIQLNDLKNPATIKLFGYPATNAANGGYEQRGAEIPDDGTNPVIGDLKNLRIGNNEISFQDLDLNLFDYIILTPGIKINNYTSPAATTNDLVFKLSYYKNNNVEVKALTLPGESNPSPPAKPAD